MPPFVQELSQTAFPFPEKIPSVLTKRSELTDLLMKLLMRRIFALQSNSKDYFPSVPMTDKQVMSEANQEALRLMQYLVLIIFAEDHQAFSIEGYPSALKVHFNENNKIDGPSQGEATSEDAPLFHYQLNKFPGPNCQFDKQGIPQCSSEDNIVNKSAAFKNSFILNSDSEEEDEEEMADEANQKTTATCNANLKKESPEKAHEESEYMPLPEGTTMRQLKSSALQALYGLVMASQIDPVTRQRDLHIVRLLAKIHQYYNGMASKLIHAIQEEIPLVRVILQTNEKSPFEDDDSSQSPLAELAAIVRLSFQPEVRQVISDLGGVYALINLLRWEHALWTEYFIQLGRDKLTDDSYQYLQQSIVLRRYICMALTNLTFGSAQNKAIICKRRLCLESLVAQLETENEDLKQVAASVLRNLSWKTSPVIRLALKKSHASNRLMNAVLVAQRDSTVKNMLSALWNLSSHSSSNKRAICSVDGFLEFFLRTIQRQYEMLKCTNDSSLLLVIESCAGILRNLASIIAFNDCHRLDFCELSGYGIILNQLNHHSSLTVLVNLINFLHTLTQVSAWPHLDIREMKQLIHFRALQILKEITISSHHKPLIQTAEAVCHNLTAWSPNERRTSQTQSTTIDQTLTSPLCEMTSLVTTSEKSMVNRNNNSLSSAEVVFRRRLTNRSRHPRIGYLSVVFETDSDYYYSSSSDESEDYECCLNEEEEEENEESVVGEQNEMLLAKNVAQDDSLEEKIKVYATEDTPYSHGSMASSGESGEEDQHVPDEIDHHCDVDASQGKSDCGMNPSESVLQSPLIFSRGNSSMNSSCLDMENLPPIQSNPESTACSNSLSTVTSGQMSCSVSRPPERDDAYVKESLDDEGSKKDLTGECQLKRIDDMDDEQLLSQVIKSAMPLKNFIDSHTNNEYIMNQESDSSTTNSTNSECESNHRPKAEIAPMPQQRLASSADFAEHTCMDRDVNNKACLIEPHMKQDPETGADALKECISSALPRISQGKDAFLDPGSRLEPPSEAPTFPQPAAPPSPLPPPQLPMMMTSHQLPTPQTTTTTTTKTASADVSNTSLDNSLKRQTSPRDCSQRATLSLARENSPDVRKNKPGISLNNVDVTSSLIDIGLDSPLPPPPTRPISIIDYEELEKEIEEEVVVMQTSNDEQMKITKSSEAKVIKMRKKSLDNLPLPPSPNEFELAILEQYRLSQSSLNSQLLTSSSSTTVYDNAPVSPSQYPVTTAQTNGTEGETEVKSSIPGTLLIARKVVRSKLPEPGKISGLKPLATKTIVKSQSTNQALNENNVPKYAPKTLLKLNTTFSKSVEERQPAKISAQTPVASGGLKKLPTPQKVPQKTIPTVSNVLSKQKVTQSVPTSPKSVLYAKRKTSLVTMEPNKTSTPVRLIEPKPSTSTANLSGSTLLKAPLKSASLVKPVSNVALDTKRVLKPINNITKPKMEPPSTLKKPVESKLKTKVELSKPAPLLRRPSNENAKTVAGSQQLTVEVKKTIPALSSGIKKPATGLKLPSSTRIPTVPSSSRNQVQWLSRQELSQN